MTKTIPHYLRIHRDSDASAQSNHASTIEATDPDSLNLFWNAYSDATGWRVDPRETQLEEDVQVLPAVSDVTFDRIDTPESATVGKSAAIKLAESAARLAAELERNREAIRRQEAELASRAPVLVNLEAQTHLADRLENVLAEAAAATRCDAAAMYMLDEETEFLKTRAVFGLPPSRLEHAPRPLKGSRADLEALVSGVAAVENLQDPIDQWNAPESFSTGLCAAIQCDDIPIGTMWLFSRQQRDLTLADSAAARLAAMQLSLELTYASIGDIESRRSDAGPILDVAAWQYEALPTGALLAPSWRVDGMIESPQNWARGWHAWDILPDGRLMLAIAESEETTARGAMSATVAQSAMLSHAHYRHTPAQMIQRVSDTLWNSSTSPQLVSMLYAQFDPESGEGEIASVGKIHAMIGGRYGYRPVANGIGDPLGHQIDPSCDLVKVRLDQDETLLAYTQGMLDSGTTQTLLGDQLRQAMQQRDANPLARIRRSLAGQSLNGECGAVTLLRQS